MKIFYSELFKYYRKVFPLIFFALHFSVLCGYGKPSGQSGTDTAFFRNNNRHNFSFLPFDFLTEDNIHAFNFNETKPGWKVAANQAKQSIKERKIDQAIVFARLSDSLYLQENEKAFFPAHFMLGICYNDKGLLPDALKHYQIALDLAPDMQNKLNTIFNMSELSLKAKDTLAVKDLLSQYADSLDNVVLADRGFFYFQYALNLSKINEFRDKAFLYYQKSLKICRKGAAYELASYNCRGILNLYLKQNLFDSCLVWQDSLAYYAQKDGSSLVMANALQTIGNVSFVQKDYHKALNEFGLALSYARQANYLPVLEDVLQKLSKLYEKNGDYKKSIEYLKEYNHVVDSLGANKWDERLLELQAKYENRRKEQQLATLRQKLDVSLRISALLLLMFLSIGILLWLYKWRKKKKQAKEMLHKSESAAKNITDDKLKIWEDLLYCFSTPEFCSNPDLSLTTLAHQLNTNRTTLSELINIKSGKTFNGFVNEYRVKEACCLLSDPQKSYLSIEGIGQEVGFKSRSAFYAAFSHEMEITPAAYRKNHSAK